MDNPISSRVFGLLNPGKIYPRGRGRSKGNAGAVVYQTSAFFTKTAATQLDDDFTQIKRRISATF